MATPLKKRTHFQCVAWLLFATATCFGQRSDFRVAINSNIIKPGDTLDLEAVYTVGEKKLPPATLDLIIENERGNTWNIRWPLIDGKAEGSIILSKCIPKGKYHFWFAVQPRVFRIYGQMVYSSRKKIKTLQANMVAGGTPYIPQQIKLEPDGSFVIKDWVLTNSMTVLFSTGDTEDVLHIHPECWLDSAYRPAAQSYVTVHVTDNDTLIPAKSIAPALKPLAWNGAGAYNNLAPAEIYNHFFSTGTFRDSSEIVIDVMGDTTINASTNTVAYIAKKLLEQYVAVEIRKDKLFYNGRELVIFYQEKLSEVSMLNIKLSDIAIVKMLRHYITTGDENHLNALAVYPRRYPFTPAGIAQNVFLLNGYNSDPVLLSCTSF